MFQHILKDEFYKQEKLLSPKQRSGSGPTESCQNIHLNFDQIARKLKRILQEANFLVSAECCMEIKPHDVIEYKICREKGHMSSLLLGYFSQGGWKREEKKRNFYLLLQQHHTVMKYVAQSAVIQLNKCLYFILLFCYFIFLFTCTVYSPPRPRVLRLYLYNITV